MKPWEKYQVAKNETQSSNDGPWSKYQAPIEKEEPGMLQRFKNLFSPETKAEAEKVKAERLAELQKQRAEGTTLGQTELEQFGNAVTFGYLPQLQAGVSYLMGDDYTKARDANIRRLEAQSEAHPVNAIAANVAGTATNAAIVPLPTLGKGAGVIGGALKGAQYGALQGAIQNPGDIEGEVNPLQLDERLQNTKEGAKLGATVGGAAGLGQKIAKGFERAGGKMKGAGEAAAFKSSGAMLKDFRQAAGKDEVNKLGRFMLDEGMVKAGDTFETVAQKAEKINQQAGKQLDRIYKKAASAAEQAGGKMPGFSPVVDKAEILDLVKKDLGDAPGAAKIAKKIELYLDDLGQKFGDSVISPRVANDIKGFIDKEINYARNPLTAKPKTEKAYSSVRRYIEKKIFDQVEHLGSKSGQAGLGKQLRETNQRYGMSKRIQNIAEDRINRVSANNAFGLTDRIAGGAGAVVGGAAAAAGGENDPLEMGTKALGAGLLAMGANHVAGKYGNAALSRGLDRTGGLLRDSSQAAGTLLSAPGQLGRMAVGLNRKDRKGLLDERRGIIVPVTEGYEQ